MINDKTSSQEGGKNSNNLQAGHITINQGITYQDAKNIALDVFRSNFLELSEKASKVAQHRAEELVDDFLKELKERNSEAFDSLENPGMQHALFIVQKEYARTGDKELAEMLVDILVDRAAVQDRNLQQIVLDESLSIVPKLTLSQIDTLTIIFILRYTKNFNISSISSLKDYLDTHIAPFTSHLSTEVSHYQHLEFTSCSSNFYQPFSIYHLFLNNYKGIFCEGFTLDQLEQFKLTSERCGTLIMECMQDKSKFQIAAIDEVTLEKKAKEIGLNENDIFSLKHLMNSYVMNVSEVKKIIMSQGEFMEKLIDVWNNSYLQYMRLTSVGIAIAAANLRRKTGISVDLGIWIK